MLRRGRLILGLLLVVTAVIIIFFIIRGRTQAAFGPPVALCPGPDLYGYTCESGTAFAYIDASNNTFLYEDDGLTRLELPFPFTFYGTTYTDLYAGSNGTLFFADDFPQFLNQCLSPEPVANMGDMIAPYWDDLDLRAFGFLEYEIVGEEPDRIFVLEWDDIPRFGDSEDRVTFEVQLFETSSDIVFLYEDVTMFEGNNGSSATIGLQSEAQGLALQFGCNQPVVADASRIRFPHPEEANDDLGLEMTAVSPPIQPANIRQAKGDVAELIRQFNLRGPAALTELHAHWLSQTPPRTAVWEWVDLTGNGREELALVRRSTAQFPHMSDLIVLSRDETDQLTLLVHHQLASRAQPLPQLTLADVADLTQDQLPDVVLHDPGTGTVFMVTAVSGDVETLAVPEQCTGSLGVMVVDGQTAIVRDGCDRDGRVVYRWDSQQLTFVENE